MSNPKKTTRDKGRDNSMREEATTKRQNVHRRHPLLGWVLIGLAIAAPQAYRTYLFGITAITGHAFWDLQFSYEEWSKIFFEGEKIILTIGGVHRSGTTFMSQLISSHPEISGFGSQFRSGVSFSEGVLLQEVLPRHGVTTELIIKKKADYQETSLGVGKFALAEESTVHITEKDDKYVSKGNMVKLLNRYGAYWDLAKNVWVDKSPTAAVMSRAFQGLYNSFESSSSSPHTKFLFTTRHPIANSYGHHHLLGGKDVVAFNTLLDNYVRIHRYLLQDIKHLSNQPKLIKMEEFLLNPHSFLTDVFTWLNVDATSETVQKIIDSAERDKGIRTDVNDKYKKRWCNIAAPKRNAIEEKYQTLIDEFDLGYDLVGWC